MTDTDQACPRCGETNWYARSDMPGFRCRTCRNASRRSKSAEARAAREGWSPDHDMTHTVPEGFRVKGVSTLYVAGEAKAQWVKTAADGEQTRSVIEALEGISHPFPHDPVPAPDESNEDLLCVYPWGDPHFGLLAWAEETGENFDLQTAEQNLIAGVDHLVELAPPAKEALIISLGDLSHADSKRQMTTAGTLVDVDSRHGKVLRIILRGVRRAVDLALKKHELVHLVMASGNHDDNTSLMLAVGLSMYYENEPRVRVNTSPAKFYWHRHGDCLLGIHHGDTAKASMLPGVMACDRAKDWGETRFRYWYCGHVHHESVKEYPGVTIETFRTLAAKDAWHTNAGYRSGQDLRLDVLHRRRGRIQRHIVGIEQIRDMVQGRN